MAIASILSVAFLLPTTPVQQTTPVQNSWKSSTGAYVRPKSVHSGKGVVLLFVYTDCPIANSYAPEINRIVKQYASQGFEFYVVYEDPEITDATAKLHASAYGFQCKTLLDPKHTLASELSATTTPEAVLLNRSGAVEYSGRIDDRVVGLGKSRPKATKFDLRAAIGSELLGRSPAVKHTVSFGCLIPPAVR